MRIGIDFDNTIVSYDALFHKVAIEQSAVPPDTAQSKLAVRDYLRRIGREPVWTEMQGYVYGARMGEAACYPGVPEFLRWARAEDIRVSIISHKTLHPFIGPKHDLHAAARAWIGSVLVDADGPLVAPERVFFELTKEAKIARIGAEACDWFIDDLPEILLAPTFPSSARGLLFDPEDGHAGTDLVRMKNWDAIDAYISALWATSC